VGKEARRPLENSPIRAGERDGSNRLQDGFLTSTLEQGADIFAAADQGRWRKLKTLCNNALVRLDCIVQALAAQDRTLVALALSSHEASCLPPKGEVVLCVAF
jgi:hypothetical protein